MPIGRVHCLGKITGMIFSWKQIIAFQEMSRLDNLSCNILSVWCRNHWSVTTHTFMQVSVGCNRRLTTQVTRVCIFVAIHPQGLTAGCCPISYPVISFFPRTLCSPRMEGHAYILCFLECWPTTDRKNCIPLWKLNSLHCFTNNVYSTGQWSTAVIVDSPGLYAG